MSTGRTMTVGGRDRSSLTVTVLPRSFVMPRGVVRCGALSIRAVNPLCQGSRSASAARMRWYDDGVLPIQLVVVAHSFPEVVDFLLGDKVLHFQGLTKKDLALEAEA